MASITPEMARAELARRQLASRGLTSEGEPTHPENLMQKVLRYGVKDPLAGFAKFGHNIINLINLASMNPASQFQKSYDYGHLLGIEHPTTADKVMQGVGQYAPSMLMPEAKFGTASKVIEAIPKVGGFLSKILGEGVSQSAYSASQDPKNAGVSAAESAGATVPFSIVSHLIGSSSPATRLLARTLLGGATGLGTAEIAHSAGLGPYMSSVIGLGAGLGAQHFGGNKSIVHKLTEGVEPEFAAERLAHAKKLGLDYITPAEASVNPWVAKMQGTLGRSSEGGKLLYERGTKRVDSERNAINSLLDTVYKDQEMGPKITALYKNAGQTVLPNNLIEGLRQNPIISSMEKKVADSPIYQKELENIPKDSLGYWHLIKRGISDLESRSPANEARILGNTRRDLNDKLVHLSTDYNNANRLYERKATREGLEKAFDKKDITGANFYNALKSKNKFNEIIGHLKDVPEAQDSLKSMRILFNDLLGPPTIKTAKGGAERGMFQVRNLGNYLETLMENIFSGGKRDEEAIKLITSPDWHAKMVELNKIPERNLKIAATLSTLGKAASQIAPATSNR